MVVEHHDCLFSFVPRTFYSKDLSVKYCFSHFLFVSDWSTSSLQQPLWLINPEVVSPASTTALLLLLGYPVLALLLPIRKISVLLSTG